MPKRILIVAAIILLIFPVSMIDAEGNTMIIDQDFYTNHFHQQSTSTLNEEKILRYLSSVYHHRYRADRLVYTKEQDTTFSLTDPSEISLNGNLTQFHGSTNKSIYIVTLSSAEELFIKDFTVRFDYYTSGITIRGSHAEGYFYTDGTEIKDYGFHILGDYYTEDELRYLKANIGSISYSIDNRKRIDAMGGFNTWFKRFNISLPAGTWHFVFMGGLFDLKPQDTPLTISVWMNISSPGEPVQIFTKTDGTLHLLSYADFDANLILSRPPGLEVMVNGKASFHSNHTFFYNFLSGPWCQGFMNVRMNTPTGLQKFTAGMIRNRFFYRGDSKVYGSIMGIGQSGEYTAHIQFLDYIPALFRHQIEWQYTFPVFLIAVDIKLDDINDPQWIPFDSHVSSPDWIDESYAYDSNRYTSARCPIDYSPLWQWVWTPWLELEFDSSKTCSKIRWYAWQHPKYCDNIDIKVYDNSAQVYSYQGEYTSNVWEERNLGVSPKQVTSVHVRFRVRRTLMYPTISPSLYELQMFLAEE